MGGTESPGGTPKILHTTDGWQTWTELSRLPSEAGQVVVMVATPFDSAQIFVGTDVGVYWTQDGRATWQPLQTGLPRVYCTGLRYLVDPTHNGNDKLVVSTFGRGLYERSIPAPGIVYVDQRFIDPNFLGDGTFEHPFWLLALGLSATPVGGILALHGDVYSAPMILNKPMTIHAYESTTQLGR
jgi:hypothetical protein